MAVNMETAPLPLFDVNGSKIRLPGRRETAIGLMAIGEPFNPLSLESSALEKEALTAPDDGVPGKARYPDSHGDKVAQGQEPQIGQNLAVAEHLGADGHRQCQAQTEAHPEEPKAQGTKTAGQHVEQGQSESVSKEETGVSPGACIADGARPAQLVIEEAAPGVSWNGGLDHLRRERDAVADPVKTRASS